MRTGPVDDEARSAVSTFSDDVQGATSGMSANGGPEAVMTIEEALEEKVSAQRALVKRLKREHGDAVIGSCTVNQAYGGMRGVTTMTYETSDVDPLRGVRIRDRLLVQVYDELPRPPGARHPYMESMLWLLLTGDVPSQTQTKFFSASLSRYAHLSQTVRRVIDAFPCDFNPMTQLSAALLAMHSKSAQDAAVSGHAPRDTLWRACLSDILAVVTQQLAAAAYIFQRRRRHRNNGYSSRGIQNGIQENMGDNRTGSDASDGVENDDACEWKLDIPRLDLAAAYARLMQFNDPVTDDLFRMHLCTHMDHGGGSASCLGVRVVGSTLADPFRAWSAALNGLAGPLHGHACSEVVHFVLRLQSYLASHPPSSAATLPDSLRTFCLSTIREGGVIPGYGHTTLRATDPRFHMQRAFAREYMPDDELCALVSVLYDVVPNLLKAEGKIRSPWPNVDAHSGVLLYNRGITDVDFHTVMFAVSRVMGPLSNLVWDRALNLPIVRPMSVTTRWIQAQFEHVDGYIPPGIP